MGNVSAREVIDFFVVDPDATGCTTPALTGDAGNAVALNAAAVADLTNIALDGDVSDGTAATGNGDYLVDDEIISVTGTAGARAKFGTKAQQHASGASVKKLVACSTETATHIGNCANDGCPSLTFVYNGIVSEKCNLVTVAANTVTASTDCQAALRAIPGLGGADVVVKKTAGAGAGGADGI